MGRFTGMPLSAMEEGGRVRSPLVGGTHLPALATPLHGHWKFDPHSFLPISSKTSEHFSNELHPNSIVFSLSELSNDLEIIQEEQGLFRGQSWDCGLVLWFTS